MTYTDPRTSINVLENMMRVDILTICTTYIKVLGEFYVWVTSESSILL